MKADKEKEPTSDKNTTKDTKVKVDLVNDQPDSSSEDAAPVDQTDESEIPAENDNQAEAISEVTEEEPKETESERYLRLAAEFDNYKNKTSSSQRKLISVEEMGQLINSIIGIRENAMMTVFAKTGP